MKYSDYGPEFNSKVDFLKHRIPLHRRNVDSKNREQINKCARDTIEYAERIENSPPPPIFYRTDKEPYEEDF